MTVMAAMKRDLGALIAKKEELIAEAMEAIPNLQSEIEGAERAAVAAYRAFIEAEAMESGDVKALAAAHGKAEEHLAGLRHKLEVAKARLDLLGGEIGELEEERRAIRVKELAEEAKKLTRALNEDCLALRRLVEKVDAGWHSFEVIRREAKAMDLNLPVDLGPAAALEYFKRQHPHATDRDILKAEGRLEKAAAAARD